MGPTPQDGLVYASVVACVAMYFSRTVAVDVIAGGFAVGASLIACLWGMPAEAGVSGFTNWVKKLSYPFCLAVVVGCIYLNFRVWNAGVIVLASRSWVRRGSGAMERVPPNDELQRTRPAQAMEPRR